MSTKGDVPPDEVVVHGIRHPKQRAYLVAYSATGNKSIAARAAHVDRTTHYAWLKQQRYADAFAQAQEVADDALEAEARRRAVSGWDEPVYYQGEVVGSVRRYSDGLLKALLAASRPEKFRTNASVEVSGNKDAPLEVQLSATEQVSAFLQGIKDRQETFAAAGLVPTNGAATTEQGTAGNG